MQCADIHFFLKFTVQFNSGVPLEGEGPVEITSTVSYAALHGFAWTSASCIAARDLRSPIGQADATLRVKGKYIHTPTKETSSHFLTHTEYSTDHAAWC